jgi:hypothetical protein
MWSLGVLGLAVLLALAPVAWTQTEGPLKIKRPPPRPSSSEPRPEPPRESRSEPAGPAYKTSDSERPHLKRNGGAESPAATSPESTSPCPAGYIAVPVTARDEDQPPRLSRSSSSSSADEPAPEAEAEEYECVFSEVVTDSSGKVVEERRAPASGDPFIEAAREKVFEFSSGLPNFVCEQLTSRSTTTSNPPRWKLRDRITADVVYLEGKERYENIRRNGKGMETDPEKSGSWSSGEFGTVMLNLFHPGTKANFKFVRATEVGGSEAKVYDLTVKQEDSRWNVKFDGNSIYPAYKGSVWIDSESLRILRIEMVATDLPGDYPMDNIEMTVDYGPVTISGREYVLTNRSENLACQRQTRNCSRNVIDFRNYRKFEVESSVATTDSSVTFEGKPELAEPPPK